VAKTYIIVESYLPSVQELKGGRKRAEFHNLFKEYPPSDLKPPSELHHHPLLPKAGGKPFNIKQAFQQVKQGTATHAEKY
jgi:hypothetical protein